MSPRIASTARRAIGVSGQREEGFFIRVVCRCGYTLEKLRWQTCSMNWLNLLLLFRKYNIRVEDIMVRDVRYITLNCCYRDLQNVLIAGHLKTLALVESAGEADSGSLLTWIEEPHICTDLPCQLGANL